MTDDSDAIAALRRERDEAETRRQETWAALERAIDINTACRADIAKKDAALREIEYLDRPQMRGQPRRKTIQQIALDALAPAAQGECDGKCDDCIARVCDGEVCKRVVNDLCADPAFVEKVEAARAPAPSAGETADMVGLSASELACYEYPGEDQGPLREAFVKGAMHFAAPALLRDAHNFGFWWWCGPANGAELDEAIKAEEASWAEFQKKRLAPAAPTTGEP